MTAVPDWIKPGAAAMYNGLVVIIDCVNYRYPYEPAQIWFYRADGLPWVGREETRVWCFDVDEFLPLDPGIAALYGVDAT